MTKTKRRQKIDTQKFLNKRWFWELVLVFIVIVSALIIFLRKDEDTWTCQNGAWQKHGNPSSPAPTCPCSK